MINYWEVASQHRILQHTTVTLFVFCNETSGAVSLQIFADNKGLQGEENETVKTNNCNRVVGEYFINCKCGAFGFGHRIRK